MSERPPQRPGLVKRARNQHGKRRYDSGYPQREQPPTRTDGEEERDELPERQHLPFLSLWIADMHSATYDLGRSTPISLEVSNNGNAASFTPIVELIIDQGTQGMWRGGVVQLPAAYSHTTVEGTATFNWNDLQPLGGSLFVSPTAAERFELLRYLTVICYDPTLDPRPSLPFDPWPQAEHHRKILTIPYWSTISNP